MDHPKSVKIFLPTLLYSFRKRYLNIVLKRGEKRKKCQKMAQRFHTFLMTTKKGGFKIFFHFLSARKKNLDLLEKEETPIAFLQHSEKLNKSWIFERIFLQTQSYSVSNVVILQRIKLTNRKLLTRFEKLYASRRLF